MVADIVMSFEIACKSRGLRFRHRTEIIGSAPLTFPTKISHQFPKHSDHYAGVLQPDELFAINDTYFILEADRQNEPITRPTLSTSSYLRKILQYRAVLKSGSYKELIPNMLVLNITTSTIHADNIMTFMQNELAMSSSSMMFMGIDILGSRESYPQPLIELLDLPFRRVGHDNFIISQESNGNGRDSDNVPQELYRRNETEPSMHRDWTKIEAMRTAARSRSARAEMQQVRRQAGAE